MRNMIAAIASLGLAGWCAPAMAQDSGSAFADMWGSNYSAVPTNCTGTYVGLRVDPVGTDYSIEK